MRYRTRQLGVVEVAKGQVLCFVAPLLGFESFRKYVLLPIPGARPFFWLQSLEAPQLAFPVVREEELAVEYPMSPAELRRVAALSRAETTCWVVVSVPAEGAPLRPNLRAPLIVNEKKQLAAQVVLGDDCPIGYTSMAAVVSTQRRASAALAVTLPAGRQGRQTGASTTLTGSVLA